MNRNGQPAPQAEMSLDDFMEGWQTAMNAALRAITDQGIPPVEARAWLAFVLSVELAPMTALGAAGGQTGLAAQVLDRALTKAVQQAGKVASRIVLPGMTVRS